MNEAKKSLIPFLQQVGFTQCLSEKNLQEVVERLEIVTLSTGDILVSEGDKGDALYLLWKGQLQIYKETGLERPLILGEAIPGQWLGELQVLLGGERLASIRALKESHLVRFSKAEILQLNQTYRDLNDYFFGIAQRNLKELRFTSLLHKIFGVLEPTCILELQQNAEWLRLSRGDRLFARGDVGDSLYFVLNGRLNAVVENPPGTISFIVPVVSGEMIGEMSILTDEPRSASIYALRDSVLIRYNREQFKNIIEKYPTVLLKITEHLIHRFKQRELEDRRRSKGTEREIAILPHNREVPLGEFSQKLVRALSIHSRVLHLNRQYLSESLEFPDSMEFSADSPQGLRFQLWLEQHRQNYEFVVFEADLENSPWTQFCLGQVDRIVWVANGTANPDPNPIEQQIQAKQSPVTQLKQTLVLLHPNTLKAPSQTAKWLAPRTLDLHHHIRWPDRKDIDIERVARFLMNRAIGVALGGGGSRGAAHVGILKALEERGIPVDFIGGTSSGGLIAAQYAMGWDVPTIVQRNKEAISKINPFRAYTIPIISLLNWKKLDWLLQSFYEDVCIEDLWLHCFCVSTNISGGEKIVHRTGPLWRAVRATTAIPGIFVPLIENGDLLIDGAGSDNDPSLTMGELNPGPIILSCVAPQLFPKITFSYEELPSPLKIFWSWIDPWSKPIEFPGIGDILAMSLVVNSAGNITQSFATADLVLRPPVDRFGIFDFKAIDEMVRVSYEYTLEQLKTWYPDN